MPTLVIVDDTPPEPHVYKLMRFLDDEYQKLWGDHRRLLPIGNVVLVGGAHMDPFFRAEAIRGMLGALRGGKSTADAILDGVTVCEIAIQIWNTSREWQIHRSTSFIEEFLHGLVRRYNATVGK